MTGQEIQRVRVGALLKDYHTGNHYLVLAKRKRVLKVLLLHYPTNTICWWYVGPDHKGQLQNWALIRVA